MRCERERVVVVGLADAAIDRLRRAAPTLVIDGVRGLREAADRIAGAAALIGGSSPALLARGARLRWVHLFGAGVERSLVPALIASPAVITCERGIHGASVADHALALLLALTRGVAPAARARAWARGPSPRLVELAGKTAVIVGFGGIGQAIAARVRGFDMRVVAVARAPREAPAGVDRLVGAEGLDAALAVAEVLFLALPLTEATLRLIDDAALARLPAGAIVVNVGRGPLVDTDALTRALERGHLGGAGLDVCDPEPLPADHPLWSRDDVVITPHVGGLSDRTEARRLELLADNLARFAAGAPLRGVVDRRAGY